VTAASRGLGFASARALAAEGCRVAISSSDEQRIQAAASALRDEGYDVVARVADVRQADQCRDLVAWATAALGGRVPSVILFPSSGSVSAIGEYLVRLRDDGHRPVVAAMGPSSSETAGEHGWPPDVVAPSAEVGAFVQTVTRFVLENGA